MDLWLTLVLGAIVLLLFYRLLFKDTNYFKDLGIKEVTSYPLVGSMLESVLLKNSLGNILADIYNKGEGEKLFGYFQFMTPIIMVRDPELINQILIKDFSHFNDRGFPSDEKVEPLSVNISNVTGNTWRKLRYKMTPTFTSGKLKNMFNQMVDCSDDALNYLKLHRGEQVESRTFSQKLIVNIIGSVAFSINVDAFNEHNKDNQFFEFSQKFFSPTWNQILKIMFKISFPKLGSFLRIRLTAKDVQDFFQTTTKNIIENREQTNVRRNDFLQLMLDLRKQELTKGSSSLNGIRKPVHESKQEYEEEDNYLLDQLQDTSEDAGDDKQLFTDNYLAANTFAFISAGSETTSAVLSFVCYHLALNLEMQKKAQEEIDTILSTQNFDYKAVKAMTYLDGIIYETLRLYPPGTFLQRVCTEDYKIPNTDKIIKKGSLVTISVLGIHKDPQYYPNPEQFNPERFEDLKSLQKIFFPFGAGPRICIAMRLAMMEMKVFTARLLSKFTIKLGEKTRLPIKLKPTSLFQNVQGGLWLRFEER